MRLTIVPTVEERIRSSLALCRAFKHIELLADQGGVLKLPGFTRRRVLRLLPTALDALADQLNAMFTALEAHNALNIEAPLVETEDASR